MTKAQIVRGLERLIDSHDACSYTHQCSVIGEMKNLLTAAKKGTPKCPECRHLVEPHHLVDGCHARYSAFQGRVYRCKCTRTGIELRDSQERRTDAH